MTDQVKGSNTLAFVSGAIIGAAIVFLLATNDGRKITAKLTKALNDFSKDLDITAEKVLPQVEDNIRVDDNSSKNYDRQDRHNIDYIKDLQNRGRTISRRFFKRH